MNAAMPDWCFIDLLDKTINLKIGKVNYGETYN